MLAMHGEVVRDDAHRYWLAGQTPRELVGVSAVLHDARFIDGDHFTDYHRDRGSIVHAITEKVDAGDLSWHGWCAADPVFTGYGDSYERLLEEHRPVWFLSEQIVFDPPLGYAGTLDRFGRLDAQTLAVVDFKSGGTMAAHKVQTAAYRRCIPKDWPALLQVVAEPEQTIRRFTIELQRDGSRARLVEHTHAEDAAAFLSALNCYHWRDRHVRNAHVAHA